jgi:Putative transposase
MPLSADEFIRRFLLHVLPSGFHRIRYYGFLANPHRKEKLELCRQLLGMAPSEPSAPATPRTIGIAMRDSRVVLCGNVPSAIGAGWSPSRSCPRSVLHRLSRTPHDPSPAKRLAPAASSKPSSGRNGVVLRSSKPSCSQRHGYILLRAGSQRPHFTAPQASFPRLPADCSPRIVSSPSNKTHSATASAAV